MPAAPLPTNEAQRIAELKDFEILDTVSEATYDAITYLASQICDVPIALISIVDDDRQWFKSRVGLDVSETDRDQAFCAYAIHEPQNLVVVSDATTDSRFSDNPLVLGDPNIRFYAGSPLVTASGNALGTLCVIDRKPRSLSREQEKALDALSTQVMALLELRRSLKLLEEKQRQLEEATRQRDSFMATISHEIRTPLTAVIGYIEMLRDGVPDELRAEVIDTVARQAADVENLLEDLLIAARAEANSLRVASVPVQLAAQAAQVIEGFPVSVAEAIVVETRPARAVGDPARVRQIARNLLSNAVRYGGPTITVRSYSTEKRAHLMVVDDGDGIPPEEQDLVFQPFQQSSQARYVESSVGLGLPISRLLAEKMGGSLTYRYRDGHSIFDLDLPSTPSEPSSDAPGLLEGPAAGEGVNPLQVQH
jgi:two-component system, sensor histidine kinase